MNPAFIFIRSTWGMLQSMLGFILFLTQKCRRHFWYHGAVVTEWSRPGGISLGLFLFVPAYLPEHHLEDSTSQCHSALLAHEYGHACQSLLLGPLYLFIIGLPSFIWATLPFLRAWRMRNNIPYDALYTERWATILGDWFCKGV